MSKMSWIAYLVESNYRDQLIDYLMELGLSHPEKSADELLKVRNTIINDNTQKESLERYNESEIGESYGGE